MYACMHACIYIDMCTGICLPYVLQMHVACFLNIHVLMLVFSLAMRSKPPRVDRVKAWRIFLTDCICLQLWRVVFV